MEGYYLSAGNICFPCASSSYCSACSSTNSSVCLSCFENSYLSKDSVCIRCSFPCSACMNQVPTMCSACVPGYTLVQSNHSCAAISNSIFISFGPIDYNCANSILTTDSLGSPKLTCNYCYDGYALTVTGCTPCIQGCTTCSPYSLNECITCGAGFMLN